jgi:tetratricopeptide (TPR) repeat protein
MKDRLKKPALLAKYLGMYEKNPRSKVFAPLAEAYRNLGMIDNAFEILKAGLKVHPEYTMGHLVLGECYYDQNNFEKCYKVISPYIKKNIDNILLQNLYSKCCEKLGYLEEALDSRRYLLFLNPKDKISYAKIKELEKDLSSRRSIFLNEAPTKQINVTDYFEDTDNWVEVNFDKKPLLEKSSDNFIEEATQREVEETKSAQAPIVSHTLVDLYLSQGHKDKAIEILESIIDLHPSDQRSIIRLNELRNIEGEIEAEERDFKFNNPLISNTPQYQEEDHSIPQPVILTEEKGHEVLLDLIEEKVNKVGINQSYSDKLNYKKIKTAYNLFLDKINDTAKDKQSHQI